MRERTRGVTAKDVERVLAAFSRASRARGLYQTNSAALARMRADVFKGFGELLEQLSVLTLRVRSGTFVYEDQVVMHDDNPDQSIPFALYRDGVRRVDFSRGLNEEELDVFMAAISKGFAFSGLGDDIVSALWKHDLEHIQYLVVDTTIVDAAQAQPVEPGADGREILSDLDTQIDGLLRTIYGDSADDVGPRSIHLDGTDIAAKAIAESLDDIDEMAPGFHPPRTFIESPAYGARFSDEIAAETPNRISARAANAALRALHADLTSADKDEVSEALLRMFDDAIVSGDIPLATRIVTGVRARPEQDARTQRWLSEAISDTRLRQAASTVLEGGEHYASFEALYHLLEACGPAAAPSILGLIPGFADATSRRVLSDLVVKLGVADLSGVTELLGNEQLFVVQEGLHILNRIGTPEALDLEHQAEDNLRVEVRMAALQAILEHRPAAALARAERLLYDPEPRAKAAAAQALAQVGGKEAATIVERPELEQLPPEVMREVFRAYARLGQVRALHVLARFVKKGEGLLAKRDAEELSVAAMDGVMLVRTPRSVEILKKAAIARSKRVREAARARLSMMKGKS